MLVIFFSRERWGGVLCRLTVSFDHSWVQVVFGSSLARSVKSFARSLLATAELVHHHAPRHLVGSELVVFACCHARSGCSACSSSRVRFIILRVREGCLMAGASIQKRGCRSWPPLGNKKKEEKVYIDNY